MTSFFVLGGSSPFGILEDLPVANGVEEVDEAEVSVLSEDFWFSAEVEVAGAGLASWFLSFSRRCFKYNVLFILDSAL